MAKVNVPLLPKSVADWMSVAVLTKPKNDVPLIWSVCTSAGPDVKLIVIVNCDPMVPLVSKPKPLTGLLKVVVSAVLGLPTPSPSRNPPVKPPPASMLKKKPPGALPRTGVE